MVTISEQVTKIEEEIRKTPFHKGTEHHIGRLRAKLSKLKARQAGKATRKKGGGNQYAIKKQGDATVVMVGPPSVGKSTLFNQLTNAKSKIAPYAFTTVSVIPGMMEYKDASIQILDVPGIIGEAEKGKGRGKEVLSVARNADLLLIIVEPEKLDYLDEIKKSLYHTGIRINQSPPKVVIEKKQRGNIIIHSSVKGGLDKETVKTIASEFGYKNAEITIKEKLSLERLIDAFATNRVFLPAIFTINKSDLLPKLGKGKKGYLDKLIQKYDPVIISSQKGSGLDHLKELIWNQLKFIRVYLVRPGEEPGLKNPQVMKKGQSLQDVAEKIGGEFMEGKEKAKIWASGAKFPGQVVSLSAKIKEGMQVRFV